MARQVIKTVYTFAELSEKAKAKAVEWYRTLEEQGNDWYDLVYEEADRFAQMIGIEMDRKPVQLMGGSTRYDPCIWFSGFASQGDGACFEGKYAYAKGGAAKLTAEAPCDEELAYIAKHLQGIQHANGYRLTATVKHSGHYYHEYCTDIDVMKGDDCANDETTEEVKRLLRRFMKWIYRQLEAEDTHRLSDETLTETLMEGDHEFESDGTPTRD